MNSPTHKKLLNHSIQKFGRFKQPEIETEAFQTNEVFSKVGTSLSFSLIDEKTGDLNSLSFQTSPSNSLLNSSEKEDKTWGFSPENSLIQKKVYEKSFKIQQLEIELEYNKEQLKITEEELFSLKSLLQQKDCLINELLNKSESGKLFQEILEKKDQEKAHQKIQLEELSKTNESLRNEVKTLFENREIHQTEAHLFNRQPCHKRGQNFSFDFQRQVGKALEKEIFQLKSENDHLRMKICEIQGLSGTDSLSLFRKLRSELKVETADEVLKRVIFLKENYFLSKQLRDFLIKAKQIVSRRCDSKNISMEKILSFLSYCSPN
jgi:hypothetical protein